MRTAVLLGTKTLASAVATRLGPASIASHQVLTQVQTLGSGPCVHGLQTVTHDVGQGQQREGEGRCTTVGQGAGRRYASTYLMRIIVWFVACHMDVALAAGDFCPPVALNRPPRLRCRHMRRRSSPCSLANCSTSSDSRAPALACSLATVTQALLDCLALPCLALCLVLALPPS